MRRTAIALALLLAAAPVAGATEITPEVKPNLQVAETAAPAVRESVVVAPAQTEIRSAETARTRQMDRESWTIVLVAAAVIVLALLFLD